MKTLIVHLSDFHIKANSVIDDKKINSISRVISQYKRTVDHTIVIISGDLAFSGTKEEYANVGRILDNIDGEVGSKLTYILCPGNHDCNFSGKNDVRDDLIDTILSKKRYTDEHVGLVTGVQANFRDFSRKYKTINVEQCILGDSYNFEEYNISVKSINNVWMAQKKCEPGKTYLDPDIFNADNRNGEVSILVMHQTMNWFIPELQRKIRSCIANNYSFVFTGHEHETSEYKLGTPAKDDNVIMIEGAELSPLVENDHSGFNIVIIDSETQTYIKLCYFYNKSDGIYTCEGENERAWSQFYTKNITAYDFDLREKHKRYLNDSGAPYSHPSGKVLSFEDIFIYPDIKEDSSVLDSSEGKKINRNVNLASIVRKIGTKAIIAGGERSGKTACCKKIFLDKFCGKKIPILINARTITNSSGSEIEKIILKSFIEQYDTDKKDLFGQIPNSEKVIIIDDFHLAARGRERYKILNYLASNYGELYVFIDEYLKYNELAESEATKDGIKKTYTSYSIREFGYIMRNELISRWYGEGGAEKQINYYKLIDAASKILDTLVVKNYVPSYPFYLYTALSAFDATQPNQIAESSYGYYYNSLLTIALAKININSEEIDLRTNYLTELAYFIKKLGNSSVTYSAFSDFHKFYCDKYQIDIDDLTKDMILSQLKDASILDMEDDAVFFKYKYFYYYFIARYVANHFDDSEIQKFFNSLCETLYHENSSNILMFLTHLSKDKRIIDTIVDKASLIFGFNCPIRLEDDASMINELIGEIPNFIMADQNVDEIRKKQLEMKDSSDTSSGGVERYSGKTIDVNDCKANKSEEFPSVDEVMQSISATYKTLDIIGQILKNYYGSIPKDQKTRLCQQGFELPLRALADFISLISQNRDLLVDDLKTILERKKSRVATPSETEKHVKKFLFHISEGISFSFIQKTSRAIGSEKLKQTYKDVMKANQSNAMSLIDISIKVDSFQTLPINEIKSLAERFKNNVISFSVLRDIVVNRLYMYKHDYRTTQALCSAVGIDYKSQQLARASALESGEPHT